MGWGIDVSKILQSLSALRQLGIVGAQRAQWEHSGGTTGTSRVQQGTAGGRWGTVGQSLTLGPGLGCSAKS